MTSNTLDETNLEAEEPPCDSIVSNDVISESHDGSLMSLVFLKSCIRFFNDSRTLSKSMFAFSGWGLALGFSSFDDDGFKFY